MQNLWSDFESEASLQEGVGQGARYRRLSEAAVLFALREWLLHDYVAAYGRSLGATRIFRRCYWVDGLMQFPQTLQSPQTGLRKASPSQTVIGYQRNSPQSSKDAPIGTDSVGTGGRKDELMLAREQAAQEQGGRKGRGRAGRKEQEVAPVLQPVIEVARVLACEERPIALQGIVLEGGSGKRKEGRRAGQEKGSQAEQIAKPFVLPKESSLVHMNWLEVAPALLPAIEQAAGIFLLNPFKDAIFTYDDLAPLYARTAPTELCFFISYRHMERRLLPSLRTSAGAAAFTALLRSDRWKKLLPKEEDGRKEGEGTQETHVVEDLLDAFMNSMRPHFLTVQRLGVPVLAGPALVEEAPYALIFATRRQDSLMSMNDAACLYKRRLDEESHRGVLTEDWFVAQRQERAEEQMRWLCQRVLQLGKAQRVRRWPDLRQQLLIAHFGRYTVHDYDEVIDTLLRRGEVRCEWRRRVVENGAQEERRIPGNDDALLWK